MTKAIAVIGANYGDEGKGATVHGLVQFLKAPAVIRFNGGAQAGHTVHLKDGKRFIFHCYGSGTLAGATTEYTPDVLVNPIRFQEENNALAQMGVTPLLPALVPGEAIIVTPWDIALNQFMELGRGAGRHGSCAEGINEATARHLHPNGVKILAEDMVSPGGLVISGVLQDWYRRRVKEEIKKGTFAHLPEEVPLSKVTSPETMAKALSLFLQYPSAFQLSARIGENIPGKSGPEFVLYEGAQGLLLDQDDKEHFPHVTRSSPGLRNVIKDCDKKGYALQSVYYVTRPYLTRHGNGPMLAGVPCAEGEDPWDQGADTTNHPNPYQGSIRFGHLDWKKLGERIHKDLSQITGPKPNVRLAVTCIDQIHNQEKYLYHYGDKAIEMEATDEDRFLAQVQGDLGFQVVPINGRKG